MKAARVTYSRYVVGVDLGGTKILAAVLDGNYRILSRVKKNTRGERGPKLVIERIVACIDEAINEAGLTRSDIGAITVGAPGMCEPATGKVAFAPNLAWHNVQLGARLSKLFAMPVWVENDVNLSTLAVYERELRHRAKPPQNVVGIFVGTGIGSGIIIGGQLYRGRNFSAGEFGHMVLSPNSGPKCGCGNQGCLEAYAGRQALGRRIAELTKEGKDTVFQRLLAESKTTYIKSRQIAEALNKRDPVVRKLVDEAAALVGVAIANVIHVLCPDLIVLGGGVIERFGDYVLPRVVKAAQKHTIPACGRGVRIVSTRLGDDAGILGAAVLAQQNLRAAGNRTPIRPPASARQSAPHKS